MPSTRRPLTWTVALAALLAPAAAWADCPKIVLSKHLQAKLDTARTVWGQDAFAGAVAEAEELLPCVRTKVGRDLAAEYHRFYGLRDFAAGDTKQARAELLAARLIEPEYTFDPGFVPEGDPVLELWAGLADAQAGAGADGEPVGAPPPSDFATLLKVLDEDGSITYDGVPTPARPVGVPVVVQILNNNGVVQVTSYLQPGDPLPPYGKPEPAVAAAEPPAAEPDPLDAALADAQPEEPGTTVEEPETTVEEPETTVEEPETTVEEPETTVEEPDEPDPLDAALDDAQPAPLPEAPEVTEQDESIAAEMVANSEAADDVERLSLPSDPDNKRGVPIVPLVPLAGGAALAAAGGIWAGVARGSTLKAWDDGTNATSWPEYLEAKDRYDKGSKSVGTAVTLTATGGVIAGLGAIGLVGSLIDAPVAPIVVPGGAGVGVRLGGRR